MQCRHRGGEDVKLYSFLTLALGGGEGGVVIPGHGSLILPGKSPGTQCTGGRVGPRTGLDGCGQEEISFPHRGSTLLVLLGKHFDTGNV